MDRLLLFGLLRAQRYKQDGGMSAGERKDLSLEFPLITLGVNVFGLQQGRPLKVLIRFPAMIIRAVFVMFRQRAVERHQSHSYNIHTYLKI